MDLKPTEPIFDIIHDGRNPDRTEVWTREEITADIKKNGIKYMLQIDSEGNILNGNERYWIARKLFLEGDMRFEYLPVELSEMSGKFILHFEDEPTNEVAREMFGKVLSTMYEVIPTAKGFQDYAIDDQNDRRLDRAKYVVGRRWQPYTIRSKDGWGVLFHKKVRE